MKVFGSALVVGIFLDIVEDVAIEGFGQEIEPFARDEIPQMQVGWRTGATRLLQPWLHLEADQRPGLHARYSNGRLGQICHGADGTLVRAKFDRGGRLPSDGSAFNWPRTITFAALLIRVFRFHRPASAHRRKHQRKKRRSQNRPTDGVHSHSYSPQTAVGVVTCETDGNGTHVEGAGIECARDLRVASRHGLGGGRGADLLVDFCLRDVTRLSSPGSGGGSRLPAIARLMVCAVSRFGDRKARRQFGDRPVIRNDSTRSPAAPR